MVAGGAAADVVVSPQLRRLRRTEECQLFVTLEISGIGLIFPSVFNN
jgi:hypothetical protein